MKVVFIVPFYQRLGLTELCFRELSKQVCPIYSVGSEGNKSKELACKYGVNYVEFKNYPVSNKNNALLQSLKSVDYDYAILLGSDNFVNVDFVKNYTTYLSENKPLVSQLDSVYFYNQKTKTKSLYKGFTGVGRAFSRELIERMNYKLWEDGKNSGLDTSTKNILNYNDIEIDTIDSSKHNIKVLDVKYSSNITNHSVVGLGVKLDSLDFDLSIFNGLSNYSEKTIKIPNMIHFEKTKIVIQQEVAGMKIGQVKEVKKSIAKTLVSRGVAIYQEEKPSVELPNLDDMNKKELIAFAKEKEIEVNERAKVADLREELKNKMQ